MLSTMAGLGVLPDFLIYHSYAQNPGSENDSLLLQESALTWPAAATGLRNQLTDYVGAAGAGIQLLVTENNSVKYQPREAVGKPGERSLHGGQRGDPDADRVQFPDLVDMYNGQAIRPST